MVLSGNGPSPADTLCCALKRGSHNVGTIAVSRECRAECFLSFRAAKELLKSGWLSLLNRQRGGGGDGRMERRLETDTHGDHK